MSIRIRRIESRLIALCAARSVPYPSDIYLDDDCHAALISKFREDYDLPVFDSDRPDGALRAKEESDNENRVWWDQEYVVAEPDTAMKDVCPICLEPMPCGCDSKEAR